MFTGKHRAHASCVMVSLATRSRPPTHAHTHTHARTHMHTVRGICVRILLYLARYGDGDGTVPLVSLGFMCERGWPESPAHNPAVPRSRMVVREYQHDRSRNINIRDITWLAQGGTATADHVNILGSFVRWFVGSLVRSFIRWFVHSLARWLVRSSVRCSFVDR